ncbi:MAG TPA: hypothetical protein VF158_02230, partial [Longimicrobiales bacterium]
MRTGWNPRLAALLQRPDPAARLIPEAVVTSAEDVRRRRDEWETGAVTGDVQTLPSGGVRLTGQVREYVSQTTRGDWITDLDPAGALHVARLRWPGARYAESEITRIRVWLHPRLDGGLDQEVAYWECRVWSLMRYRVRTGGLIYVSIAPAAAPVRVVAGGAEGEVTFAFDGLAPAGQTPIFEGGAELVPGPIYPDPVTYISVAALKSDGSPAGNVGWAIDPNKTDPITSNPAVTLDGWTLTEVGDSPTDPELAGWWRDDSGVDPVPYIIVERGDLAPATVEFSGAAQIDLGAPPAADELVEFVAQGETPSDSDLVFEVLDDAGTTWVPVRDGQTVDELPGVSARQTYAMRVTLTPNGEGDVSPVARDLGVRTVRRWTLTGLADVHIATTWGFDPRTFVGSIPDGRVTILRDGSRDYRDFATELLSQHPAADIAVRLWVGSERLPRSDWLLIDVWELEAYDPQPGAIHLDCISPAARLRTARIPVIDEVRGVREPLVYTNDSLADVYADLIAGQIALPERFRGAGVSDDVTLVGNTIEDSEGKTELDAISYLAGGTTIASQGLVKFVDIVGAAGIRAVFPAEEIEVVGATPGLRQAVPEWIVPWDWSEEEGRFRGEVPVHHIPALEAVRQGRLDAPGSLAPEIARWIASEDHAKAIGTRHVSWFGTGLIQIHLRAEYPHPYLEPGDLVLVELRDLVARDPNTARALKGQLWALAVVNEVAD